MTGKARRVVSLLIVHRFNAPVGEGAVSVFNQNRVASDTTGFLIHANVCFDLMSYSSFIYTTFFRSLLPN